MSILLKAFSRPTHQSVKKAATSTSSEAPPPGYVVRSPVYYGPVYDGPYFYRPYFGFGWRGGWGYRHRW